MFFLREMCISQEKKSAKNSGKMSGRSLRQIIYLHQDRSFVFIFHRLSRKMLKLFPLSSLPLRNMTYLRNASSLLLDSLSSNMALARNVSPPKNVCPLRNVLLLRIVSPPKKTSPPEICIFRKKSLEKSIDWYILLCFCLKKFPSPD